MNVALNKVDRAAFGVAVVCRDHERLAPLLDWLQTPLSTTSSSINQVPRWSPDGTQIVFASYQSGKYQIYVRKSDGTVQNISGGSFNDFYPDWQPLAKFVRRTHFDLGVKLPAGCGRLNTFRRALTHGGKTLS
ncbi:MAG: hypothetical protein P9F75_11765 [Candidatus Contendobacter sp.]|nr:hypothetical protein [Candidatus Contendobacter sp.]